MHAKAEILRIGMLAMQVCVPEEWGDDTIEEYANDANPAGTMHGWTVRKDGPDPYRVTCQHNVDYIHVVLIC